MMRTKNSKENTNQANKTSCLLMHSTFKYRVNLFARIFTTFTLNLWSPFKSWFSSCPLLVSKRLVIFLARFETFTSKFSVPIFAILLEAAHFASFRLFGIFFSIFLLFNFSPLCSRTRERRLGTSNASREEVCNRETCVQSNWTTFRNKIMK